MNMLKLTAALALTALLAGCSTLDNLASVGETPKLTAIADPTAQAGYRPVQMPLPAALCAVRRVSANLSCKNP